MKNRKQLQEPNDTTFPDILQTIIVFIVHTPAFSLKVICTNAIGEMYFTGKGILGLLRRASIALCAFIFIRFFDGYSLDLTQPGFYFSGMKGTSYLVFLYGYAFIPILALRIIYAFKYSKNIPSDFPGTSMIYGKISGINSKNIKKLGEYHYSDRYDFIISVADPLTYFALGWLIWKLIPSEGSFGLMVMIMSTCLLLSELPLSYRRFIKRKENNELKKAGYMAMSKEFQTRKTANHSDFASETVIF